MAENVNKYLKDGYRKFQLKVGGNASDDICRIRAVRELLDVKTKELRESSKMKIKNGVLKAGDLNDESNLHIPLLCDANTGWLQHDAVRVSNRIYHYLFLLPFLLLLLLIIQLLLLLLLLLILLLLLLLLFVLSEFLTARLLTSCRL